MEQKVIITKNQDTINNYLSQGWMVKLVTAQPVAVTGTGSNSVEGNFCFVLERSL